MANKNMQTEHSTTHTPVIERTAEDVLRFERDMARIQAADLLKELKDFVALVAEREQGNSDLDEDFERIQKLIDRAEGTE